MPYRMYFYRTVRGECEVRTFLRELPWKHRLKCVDYLNRVRQNGTRLPANVVKHIEEGLWEARPEYGGIEYRFFFAVIDSRIGVVSAIVKKRQHVERKVIERALKRAEEMRRYWQEKDNE